jgi:hypothetical protein
LDASDKIPSGQKQFIKDSAKRDIRFVLLATFILEEK